MPSDRPGDRDYRAFVGPADQYDLIGAAQFALLYALGLRQHHRLLDLGCGSLRAGRMLIAYLEPANYLAVEPDAGPGLMPVILASIRTALAPGAIAAVTFVHSDTSDADVVHVDPHDHAAAPWRYPGCYAYERSAIAHWVSRAGLVGIPIPWYHPRQTWWLLAHDPTALPPAGFLGQLTGVTLAEGCELSWHRG